MRNPAYVRCVVLLVGCSLSGCTLWQGDQSDSPTVARGADIEVTLEDLDHYVRESLFQERTRGGNPAEVYELRAQALDALIEDLVLQRAAEARDTDVEKLVAAEREPVGDDDVQAFFDENRDRLGEAPFEELSVHIRNRLEDEKGREWVESLVGAADVAIYLDPPRFELAATGPFLGPEEAPIAIVEFSDFECPFCERAMPVIKQVLERYPDQVRVHYRHLPLESIHPRARPAAEASVCAEAQGKFWEFHDRLFGSQRALGDDHLRGYATEVGLDLAAYDRCLEERAGKAQVDADVEAARAVGISGTPAFFINGVLITGAQPLPAFERVIEHELAAETAALTGP